MTASMRADLEKQVAGELAQAGSLPPGLQRATEQALRARGAATGNILGNAAALREALGVSQAIQSSDERRRAQALGLLQSGQSTSDTANRMAQQSFQNILAATGTTEYRSAADVRWTDGRAAAAHGWAAAEHCQHPVCTRSAADRLAGRTARRSSAGRFTVCPRTVRSRHAAGWSWTASRHGIAVRYAECSRPVRG